MATMMSAPQRAQRVRGVPGVGLRTADGREWLPKGRIQFVHPLKKTGQCSFPSILLARGATATASMKRASAVSGVTVGVTA